MKLLYLFIIKRLIEEKCSLIEKNLNELFDLLKNRIESKKDKSTLYFSSSGATSGSLV